MSPPGRPAGIQDEHPVEEHAELLRRAGVDGLLEVSAPDRPATLTARAFFAVREILCSALASDVALPPGLDAAARAIAGVDDAQKLDWPIRGQVERAMEWLAARCGEETETPSRRTLEFRVSSVKQGGRGPGRWLTPWGAAKEFVDCFGARMSTRLHDATRER